MILKRRTNLSVCGADVNRSDNNGQSGLHVTADDGHFELLELLLAVRIELNSGDVTGLSALH